MVELSMTQVEVLKYVVLNQPTTYEEIANSFSLSINNVRRIVSSLEEYLESIEGVNLKITPGVGIEFRGDISQLKVISSIKNNQTSQDLRVIEVLSRLLQEENYITIQDLANELYVSRTTLENTLKVMRVSELFAGLEYVSGPKGIKVAGSERIKRRKIKEIINFYWGGIVAIKEGDQYELDVEFNFKEEIPFDLDTIDQVSKIFNLIIKQHNLYLTEYEYQSMVVSLSIAIDRIQSGYIVDSYDCQNNLNAKSLEALVSSLESLFGIKIPNCEKHRIDLQLYFIENNSREDMEIKKLKKFDYYLELQEIIYEVLGDIQPDYDLIKNLIVHMNAMIKRLKMNFHVRNPYTPNIKKAFPRSYTMAVSLAEQVEKVFPVSLSEDEISYIALHVQTHLEKQSHEVIKAILICSSGYGTSKFLEQRILSRFDHKIEITRTVSLSELNLIEITENIIISTIPIDYESKPVIYVSPLLSEIDEAKILSYIENDRGVDKNSFINLLDSDLFYISEKKEEFTDVILFICERLISKEKANAGVTSSALYREKLSTTELNKVAMPHSSIEYILEPSISVYINREGIRWKGEEVYLVFFFGLNPSVKNNLDDIYSFFNTVVSSNEIVEQLSNAQDFNQFIEVLERI